MKATYLLLFCTALLLAVACRQEEQTIPPTIFVSAMPAEATPASAPKISLDSFQRSASTTLPVKMAAAISKNKLLIRRDKDSLTVSGVVFAEGEHKTKAAWHFYFRASDKKCFAYLKQDFRQMQNGVQKLTSREAGYCLHFFNTAG